MASMCMLHDIFASRVDALRGEQQVARARHGVDGLALRAGARVFGGALAIEPPAYDTSMVDPERGLVLGGVPVLDLVDRAPEDVFFLLLAGRLPSAEESQAVREVIATQERVPEGAWHVIENMPPESHPVAMLSVGLIALANCSVLARRVAEGAPRDEHWRATLDDALRIFGSLPTLAAGVYRIRYKKGPRFVHDPLYDWATDFCAMLGHRDKTFAHAMRLAAIVQGGHEDGSVCGFVCRTVGSALSNPYLAVSAGFNGLAGALCGGSVPESTRWVLDAMARFHGVPTDEQVETHAQETLRAGRAIPGYGHAAWRGPDPRFTAMLDFGRLHFEHDPVFETVERMSRVVPHVLLEEGQVANPYPNVDLILGPVWHHFGITELEYYAVPFAAALAAGMLAQLVIDRALETPVARAGASAPSG